jgi:hypothetical protein
LSPSCTTSIVLICYGTTPIVQPFGQDSRMNHSRITQDKHANRRVAVRRRATRALVAGYIHELSERHGANVKPARTPGRAG